MKEGLQKLIQGEVLDDEETLQTYSHDASLFEVRPKLVIFPRNVEDIKTIVKYASERNVSITVRSAGTDMSGGAIGEGIILDVTKYLNKVGEVVGESVWVEPGAFYRDFETKTLTKGLEFPAYPASKALAAIGGMVGNNCAGEKTLRYGKMEDYLLESSVIFADGNEYEVKPLTYIELKQKISKNDFEGNLYKQILELVTFNEKTIKEARPDVSKNSAGYYLWNVWDGTTFDLNKLLVGSQGTLGIFTKVKLGLVPLKKHHDLVALFFKSWDELPRVVNAILPLEPESLETFDKDTLELGIRFMPEIAKKAHSNLFKFGAQFLPEALIGVEMLGLPELIVLVEIAEKDEEDVKKKCAKIIEAIKPFKIWHRNIEKDSEEEKFWVMRRESFNLLRQHVNGKRTAPFIEDFCIKPEYIPEFLPQAKKILEDNGIPVNIAGHAGNGNFHIIPLMDLTQESERAKIFKVAELFYSLVGKYKGTITAEHNDGIIRTPFLYKMYSREILDLFQQTKQIFDPQNIFNPGKKVPSTDSGQVGTIEYLNSHITKN
jgi:FAD/FMN-containing dehydrogenase